MLQVTKHFDIKLNCAILNNERRKIFCRQRYERLTKSLDQPILKRKVGYGSMIKYDCYKLIKHILGEKEFKAFSLKE